MLGKHYSGWMHAGPVTSEAMRTRDVQTAVQLMHDETQMGHYTTREAVNRLWGIRADSREARLLSILVMCRPQSWF